MVYPGTGTEEEGRGKEERKPGICDFKESEKEREADEISGKMRLKKY